MASGKQFWNKEYADSKHFSLSDRPADDLLKFTRWIERNSGRRFLNPLANVLDLGCGNGRNLIYLAKNYGCRGTGYDISDVAIKQAKQAASGFNLDFSARSVAEGFGTADNYFDIVLDMMVSHYLPKVERLALIAEIARVLKTGGWFLYKTFLLNEDQNAKRMLRKYPTCEPNSYIHPIIETLEHVSTEKEIRQLYGPYFEIHKIEKTGKHILRGKAGKRRSIIVYMKKLYNP